MRSRSSRATTAIAIPATAGGALLPPTRHLARRYDRSADADDLEQIAALELLKAIRSR
jgi:hypothetical protein